jgi:flagellar biogenesis protein FliO
MLAAAAAKTAAGMPDISIGHAFFQMIIALAVIGGCAWGGTKMLARLRGGTNARTRPAATNGLTVLSRQPLGKGLQIAVVRWGEREVLVGISGTTITFLSDPRSDEAPLTPTDLLADSEVADFPTYGARPSTSPFPMPMQIPVQMPVASPARVRTVSSAGGSRRPFLESLRDATSRR